MSIKRFGSSTILKKSAYSNASAPIDIPWAKIQSASVSPTTFTSGLETWTSYKFTVTGTITISADGYLDMLVVGGGGGGVYAGPFGSTGGGGGGNVRWGVYRVAPGSYTVTVGGGGAGAGYIGGTGGTSSFGSIVKSGGGRGPRITDYDPIGTYLSISGGGSEGGIVSWEATITNVPGAGQGGTVYDANFYNGITLNYDGSNVEYGAGGRLNIDPVNYTGNGGREGNYSGKDGVVIVKFRTK